MPTMPSRSPFLPAALGTWLWQELHHASELIVCDEPGSQAYSLIAAKIPGVRYLEEAGSIGTKRNACCDLARGTYIAHWDDDDWSSPARLLEQLRVLEGAVPSVTGYNSLLFYDEQSRSFYRYHGRKDFAIGTSLCYRRDYWKQHPFEDVQIQEDNFFVETARRAGQLLALDFPGPLIVARIHTGNTSGKLGSPQWKRVEPNPSIPGFPCFG